jgi:hypothetical protein
MYTNFRNFFHKLFSLGKLGTNRTKVLCGKAQNVVRWCMAALCKEKQPKKCAKIYLNLFFYSTPAPNLADSEKMYERILHYVDLYYVKSKLCQIGIMSSSRVGQ